MGRKLCLRLRSGWNTRGTKILQLAHLASAREVAPDDLTYDGFVLYLLSYLLPSKSLIIQHCEGKKAMGLTS